MAHLPPFETEITHLAPKGLGEGVAPDGKPVRVRAAAPGSRVAVAPAGRKKGVWAARKLATIRPPPDGVAPRCAVFDRCGGCTLQEASLAGQRAAKAARALADIAAEGCTLDGVRVHPVRGDEAAYGYRNRVEFSFGRQRWLTDAEVAAGVPREGRWLGMHAPGRFDRVVDAARCELISDAANRVLAAVRSIALAHDAPPPRDPRAHDGFWRHVRIREGAATGERLLALFTASPTADEAAWVERIAAAVADDVVGTVWCVDDGVADVARGAVQRVFGRATFDERLLGRTFRLSHESFFQTNTAGAEVLYTAIGEAVGRGGRLLDLYSGAGSIGIALADRFDEVFGLEEVAAAVDDARANAAANQVQAEYVCARVEDALDRLGAGAHVIVDPPRAGLHPKVVGRLAGLDARSLVYVACRPASLGRDAVGLRAGGWALRELWVIDLFPQTPHTEVVGRFERVG